MSEELKIGMYTTDEILEHLTEGEGRGFLGRSMYDAIIDYITNLQEKNEALIDVGAKHLQNEILYKSRCEKAIEYIKNNLTISSILDGKTSYCLNDYSFDYEELLNILNGGDKSEK